MFLYFLCFFGYLFVLGYDFTRNTLSPLFAANVGEQHES